MYRLFCSNKTPFEREISKWIDKTHSEFLKAIERNFLIVNFYGVFGHMTTRRREIIFFGYDSEEKDWKEYDFFYKVGFETKKPSWLLPGHLPRIQWMLWFCPLISERQMWTFHLAKQLLKPLDSSSSSSSSSSTSSSPSALSSSSSIPTRNSNSIIAILSKIFPLSTHATHQLSQNPFKSYPPQTIRIEIYDYAFTSPQEKLTTNKWWNRRYQGVYGIVEKNTTAADWDEEYKPRS